MGVSVETNIPNPQKKLFEGRFPGKIGAKNQRIDEKSDQFFNLGAITISDRRADDQIFLSRVTVEQYLKSRQQRHELGDSFASTQFINCCG